MPVPRRKLFGPSAILGLIVWLSGCAEGPLSRFGALNPWVRQKWAEEERVVPTYYGRRQQLRDLAAGAASMSPPEQQRMVHELAGLLRDEPVTLVRIEVVRTLEAFPTPAATAAFRAALGDKEPDVRIAACEALGRRGGPDALAALGGVLGSDTDIDVRLAATRALGAFRGDGAIQALALALDDSDPALQLRAMQSLRSASGRDYGLDLAAWREFVRGGNPPANQGPAIVRLLRKWF